MELLPDQIKIFELQKNGHWKKSQKIILELSNNILLGHVLAQKFLLISTPLIFAAILFFVFI